MAEIPHLAVEPPDVGNPNWWRSRSRFPAEITNEDRLEMASKVADSKKD